MPARVEGTRGLVENLFCDAIRKFAGGWPLGFHPTMHRGCGPVVWTHVVGSQGFAAGEPGVGTSAYATMISTFYRVSPKTKWHCAKGVRYLSLVVVAEFALQVRVEFLQHVE